MIHPLRPLLLLALPTICALVVAAGCAVGLLAHAGEVDPVEHASEVKARHEDALLQIPNVVGVGVGLASNGSAPVIQVYVAEATDGILRNVPAQLEDIGVEVIETGAIYPR